MSQPSLFYSRRLRFGRLASAVAIAAAAALLAAACSSDADDSAATPTTTAAAPTTTAAPATTTTTAVPALKTAEDLIAAAFENSRGRSVRGDLKLSFGGMFGVTMQFEGDGSQNFTTVTTLLESPNQPAGITYNVRYVDGQAYLNVELPDAFAAFIGPEVLDGWYLMGAEEAAILGIICPSPQLTELSDDGGCVLPNDYMHQVEYISDAEIIGTEVIDGIETTQVRYALDYAALSEAELGFAGDDGLAASEESIGGVTPTLSPLPFGLDSAPDTFVYDTWIDADGLTRRQVLDFGTFVEEFANALADTDVEGREGMPDIEEIANSSVVVNFYDYDTPIEIEAPAPSEIKGDVSQLMDAMGFGQG